LFSLLVFYYLFCPAIDVLASRSIIDKDHVLSAWIESARLWHPISLLQVAADLEYDGANAQHDRSQDGRVRLPVRRLRVPTTRWRPDVFWIAICLWVSWLLGG